MTNLVDQYTQIESTLALASLDITVSETHGIVIGAIANHLKTGQTPDLLKLIEPSAKSDDVRYSVLVDSLSAVYRENTELLLNGKEGFALLLPDEEDELESRVDGLVTWCKGYVLGLLYNNEFSLDQLPESGAEIVRDMMQIAEAAAGADEQKEEDWALAELEEYVKVGAQLIFEFIYSERASDAPAVKH